MGGQTEQPHVFRGWLGVSSGCHPLQHRLDVPGAVLRVTYPSRTKQRVQPLGRKCFNAAWAPISTNTSTIDRDAI